MLIIITGGLGFLGSSLANKLCKLGYKIIILDKKKNFSNKFPKNIKIYSGCDITSIDSLSKIKINKPNIILHCAGQASAAKSFEIPRKDLDINIIGTFNIISWAKKNFTKKIIYASTFNVYCEDKKKFILKENFLTEPKSLYAISKLAAENYIKVYCNFLGINWNVLRMFNIYGPGQDPNNKYLGMVSIFLNMAKKNGSIEVKGSLERFRDFIYIEDVLQAWKLVIKDNKNFNKVYNVGSGIKTTIKDLIKKISILLNKKLTVCEEKGTPGDFMGCFADINKINKDLGFLPKYNLTDGLKKFNSWLEIYEKN